MRRNLRKISITAPPELVIDLDYVSQRLGISRSALIAQVLPQSLQVMRTMLEQIPLNPTPDDAIRFRGESAEIVRQKIESLRDTADDLFGQS
jgi:Trm5-related predicted tRNA methylase